MRTAIALTFIAISGLISLACTTSAEPTYYVAPKRVTATPQPPSRAYEIADIAS